MLECVTWPNTLLEAHADERRARFFAGDWRGLSPLLERTTPEGRFDRVVSAETVYTLEAAEQMATLVSRHLARPHGIALIGAKRYYFGTGGSIAAFRDALAKREPALECEAALVIDNGHSNIREVLRVRWRA